MTTITLEILAGESIESAAERLVKVANLGPATAEGKFNDITVRAEPGQSVEDVIAGFWSDWTAKVEAWRASPEGMACEAALEAVRVEAQKEVDACMQALPGLDLSNVGAVLGWLRRLARPSDRTGVDVSSDLIVKKLEAAGYRASENTGEDFREDDRENYARWLIGQALDGLQRVGAIHGMFADFHDRWLAKFEGKQETGQ